MTPRRYICECLHRCALSEAGQPVSPEPSELSEDPAEANAEQVMAAALAYMRKVSEVQVYLTTFPELDQPSTRAAAAALDTADFDSKAAGRLLRA